MTTPCVGGCGASLSEPGMCLACLQGARILTANARRRRDAQLQRVREWADTYLVGKGYANAKLYEILDSKVLGIEHPTCAPKTPADRLADAALAVLNMDDAPALHALRVAIDEYRSTRNGIGQTTAATFGSPPDPILITRFLLDTLTGGALSSLICLVRDMSHATRRPPIFAPDAADSIRTNLRALGEKLP